MSGSEETGKYRNIVTVLNLHKSLCIFMYVFSLSRIPIDGLPVWASVGSWCKVSWGWVAGTGHLWPPGAMHLGVAGTGHLGAPGAMHV